MQLSYKHIWVISNSKFQLNRLITKCRAFERISFLNNSPIEIQSYALSSDAKGKNQYTECLSIVHLESEEFLAANKWKWLQQGNPIEALRHNRRVALFANPKNTGQVEHSGQRSIDLRDVAQDRTHYSLKWITNDSMKFSTRKSSTHGKYNL